MVDIILGGLGLLRYFMSELKVETALLSSYLSRNISWHLRIFRGRFYRDGVYAAISISSNRVAIYRQAASLTCVPHVHMLESTQIILSQFRFAVIK